MITSAPLPAEIVRAPANADALIVSTAVPPVTVARPESSAKVPSVKLFAPLAVVSFSTEVTFEKSLSMTVWELAVRVMVSFAVPPEMLSDESKVAAVTLKLSAPAPPSTDKS